MPVLSSIRITKETLAIDDRSSQAVAEHLRYIVEEGGIKKPTVGAILLFGRSPQSLFNHSSIDFVRFDGKDEACDILTRQEVTGCLDEMVYKAQQLVEVNMTRGSFFDSTGWKRVDIVEYPYRALRETLLNAVMHRNYEIGTTKIYVKIFDDRIEITSPGGLFGIVNKDNFGTGITDYRNPVLAQALRTIGLVEQVGRGIQLIHKTMKENESPNPNFVLGDTYVRVELPAHTRYAAIRYYEKGVRARERGDTGDARDYLNSAISINPDLIEAYSSLTILEADEDNIVVARDIFQKIIERSPNQESAYARWATMEDRIGNLEDARSILKKGTSAMPASALLWHQRALVEGNQGNFPENRRHYQKAISIRGNDSRIWQSFGQMEYKARNYVDSESYLRKALEFATNRYAKGWIYSDLARVLAVRKAPTFEVEECFLESLRMNPNHPQTYDYYSRYLRRIRKRQESRRDE